MSHRSGFTLVETIVALVLLQIAMLALAGGAAVAARDLSDSLTRRRALALARNRTEGLRAAACIAGGAGVRALPGGMIEHWRVDAGDVARAITDSVTVQQTRGRTTSVVSRAWVLCRQ